MGFFHQLAPSSRVCLLAFAAILMSPAHAHAAVEAARFAAVVGEFEQLSDAVMRTGQTPALAAVVVKNGAIVSVRGLGVAENGKRVAVGPDTVFRIASLSKAFAASLSALLVNERALRWEDRVQDLVPALVLKDIEGAGRLRIDELLSHRVGLPHNTLDRALEADSPYPLLLDQLDEVTPLCSVGSCYSYQNIAFSLIGQWMLAHLGHAPDVFDTETLAILHAPQISTPGEVLGSPWRRQRVREASYALGWRVFDYSGHRMIFHAGAVQGYRAALAMLPDQDFGVALMWNSESAVPAGLLPTIVDREIGLPAHDWLQLDKLLPRSSKRSRQAAR